MLRPITLLIAVAWASHCWATPAHVQGNFGALGSSQLTTAVTLTSTVTSGNMVTCEVINFNGSSDSPSSVIDDKSNTYNQVDVQNNNGLNNTTVTTYQLLNITNGPKTITAAWAANAAFPQILCDEWSGVSSLDRHGVSTLASPGSGSQASGPSVTTTANGELIVSMYQAGGNPAVPSAGTSYTLQNQDTNTSDWSASSESQVQSAAGSITATWTSNSNTGQPLIISIMAFTASGAAAPPPTRSLIGIGK
jgi:hypothetical protein